MTKPVFCVVCGLRAKNQLEAYSEAFGMDFMRFGKCKKPICPKCRQEIARFVVEVDAES